MGSRLRLIIGFICLAFPAFAQAASDVTISTAATSGGSFSGGNPNIFTPAAASAVANNATIQTSLNSGTNVIINTAGSGTGNGDLTVSGSISKTSGTATAALTLNAVRDLVISGSISASSGALSLNLSAGGAITSTPPITLNSGTAVINSVKPFTLGNSLNSGTAGLVQIQTGCVQTAGSAYVTITGSAVQVAEAATLQISGSVSGALTVSGTLSAGPAAGFLKVTGPLVLQDASTTVFHIAGTSQSSSYDYISCSGTVAISGTLQLSFLSGFENSIANNNTFTIINGSSITGTFAGLPDGSRITLPNDLGSVKINYTATAVTLSDWKPVVVELGWDPGTADGGTLVLSNTTGRAGRFYYHVYTQATDIGAWRSALSVTAGDANLYLSMTNLPTVSSSQYSSARAGSDGVVLRSDQFSAGQDWYLLVNVPASGAQWSLVSGRAYVQDLGTLGFTDTNANGSYDVGETALPSGSGTVAIGPEGMRFFKATVPTGTPAWSLWLGGDTRKLAIRKNYVPFHTATSYYDRIQAGQMLVVSPYLSTNTNTSTYFLSVTGTPGESVNLDSRIQEVTDIGFDSTTAEVQVPAAPYRVYRVQVPVQQIAWDVSVTPVGGDPNVAVRRDNAPAEYDNDAFSEVTGSATDSITLVPTFLTDATWYITVYGTGSYSFKLKNGPPVITALNYTDTKINDQTARAGWRFYALTDVNSQLGSLGWELNLANQVPGTEIAIRRNMVPSRWRSRTNGSVTAVSTGAVDYSGTNGFLQRPGHQADIWYVGVCTPDQSLGEFTLKAAPILPEALSFDAGTQAVTGQEPGRWKYQRIDVPSGAVGWDVRVRNVAGPVPLMAVRRDQLPSSTSTSWTPNTPPTSTTWPTGQQWAGQVDWSGYTYDPASPSNVTAPPRLVAGMGRPLEPGTYYVGVYNGSTTTAINLTIDSRGIGTGQSCPVNNLAYNGGSDTISNLAPREAKYYKVTIPAGTPSWELLLTPTVGELSLVMRRGTVPDFTAVQKGDASIATGDLQVKMQKTGPEHYVMTPATGVAEIPAGDYYLAVVSEGGNPAGSVIGSGAASGTLTSLGALGVKEIGTVTSDGISEPVNLAGGQLKAYTITVPDGADTLEVRLDRGAGAAVMRVYPGSALLQAPDGGAYYGSDGGSGGFDCGSGNYSAFILTVVNGMPGRLSVSPGTWSIMVQAGKDTSNAFPDATATLSASIHSPVNLDFDGGTRSVDTHPAGSWRYFKVVVPEGVMGWDIRLTDVVGPVPKMVVQRDLLPVSEITTWSPSATTTWQSGLPWVCSVDWTGYINNNGTTAPPRLVMGMGRPLQPGTYYVGVCNDDLSASSSYTVDSRGIGTNQTYAIRDLAYEGGSDGIDSLAPREARYYKVTIPANTPSWEVTLTPSAGDMDLVVRRGTIPDFLALPTGDANKEASGVPSGDVEVKMQKAGQERYVMLPNSGQDYIPAGDYYIAAVSEGTGASGSNIGTGSSSGTLASLGKLAITDLGTATSAGITQPVSLVGGQIKAYSFIVPAGTESLQVQLQSLTGTTQMRVYPGAAVPQPTDGSANYGSDGGYLYNNVKPTYTASSPTAGVWTISIQAGKDSKNAFPDSTANMIITAVGPEPVDFDSGNATVANQAASTWRYFQVTVPSGAIGWDVRLCNVSGSNPAMVVRRDVVPITTSNSFTPSSSTTWPTTQQWAGSVDWTGYTYDASAVFAPPRLVAGMGRPLEPGSYYIGVYNSGSTSAVSYTLQSRGIGTGYAYPVTELAYAGGSASVADLPRREARYFKVTIPANTPSWEVTLTPTAGEMELLVRRGTVPDFNATASGDANKESGGVPSGDVEVEMQKAGPERYVMLSGSGQDFIPAGDYYLAVVSEGVNPGSTIIGAGSSSGSVASLGALAVTDLGTASLAGTTQPANLAGGQVKAYSFIVPEGAENLEVRLDTIAGSPKMRVYPGNRIPQPSDGSGNYGSDGGASYNDANPAYSAVVPTSGTWTIVVQAGKDSQSKYPDASANISVRLKSNNPLNFAAALNSSGGSNTDTRQVSDGEYTVYKVTVPSTVENQAVLGWVINTNIYQGAVSLQVYKNAADPTSGVTVSGTDGAAVIVPPFLTFGDTWYVRVKSTGLTNYTITSTPVTLQRDAWSMPGYHSLTFGDTGTDTGGNPLPGDRGIDLAQGRWDFYAIDVPSGNAGLLRTELQGISGNPDLYIREDGVPTTSHRSTGSGGTVLYQRSLTGTTSEYGNWVPISGRTQTQLTPGRWYLGVKANGLSNARYRLIVSTGQVTDLDLNTGAVTNQSLPDNDWRYYRFTVPADAPANWALTFSQQIGDVVMWLRDALPPGQGADNKTSSVASWYSDNKNQGPYSNVGHDAAGTYTFSTPPLRPGQTYYVGFRSNNSATFSFGSATNGGTVGIPPTLAYYGGSVTASVPAGGSLLYQISAPVEGTRLKFSATNVSTVSIRLEQGTLPSTSGSQHYVSSGANATFNYALSGTSWPWLPAQTYYMRIVNNSTSDQSVSVYLDGKNSLTEDEDKDGLPDAWEKQYFNTLSYTATGDQDNDGNSNATEYADNTNPTDANSAKYTLAVTSRNGTASQSLTQAKYDKGTVVTLTNTPNAGYSFLNWYGGPFRGSDFALKATCTVTLPSDGTWTFGINSDDGARLLVNGVTVISDNTVHTATKDAFGQITLSAGNYALELVYFNRTKGASLELFAAPGNLGAFNNTFKLVGDTANGGIAAHTLSSGLEVNGFTVRQVESGSSQISSLSSADSLLAGTIIARQDITSLCDTLNFVTYEMNDGRFGGNVGFPITDALRNNPLALTVNGNYTLTALNSLPLETVLDGQDLRWSTGDNAPWTGQTMATASDGTNAAMSGPIGDGETSTVQTTVVGPGSLTYYWKVSSQSSDYLQFLIDNSLQTSISGETGWLQKTYSIASGTHTLAWAYVKDSSTSAGSDCGWLDQVKYLPTRYLLTLNAPQGTVTVSPQKSVYVPGDVVTLTATPAEGTTFIGWSGDVSGTAASVQITMNAARTVTANFGTTVAAATETEAFTWTSGGNNAWYGQTAVSFDGIDAAQSGTITANQQSQTSLTVTGPDTLRFTWKVSSELNGDFLKFLLDGAAQLSISGTVDWQSQVVAIPSGTHTVTWTYSKNGSVTSGSDAGWIDRVSLDSLQYDNWVIQSALPTPKTAPDIDFDGDGIQNLAEFAFNLDPRRPATPTVTPGSGIAGMPYFKLTGSGTAQHLQVEYIRRKNAGLTYTVEFSDSLASANWQTATATPIVTPIDDNWERVIIEDTVNRGQSVRRFGRVHISKP